jgi:hypothetical protein
VKFVTLEALETPKQPPYLKADTIMSHHRLLGAYNNLSMIITIA